MKKNLFIALEGIDGCGKSTQAKLLSEKLTSEGHIVYLTFEPTDSYIGKTIRNILQHKIEADHKTIAALFTADRLDHILNKTDGLLKKLDEGFTVITDRYYFSSYAYHGAHISLDWVIKSNSMSAELLRPDLNIFIDLLPEISMQRLNKGRNALELFETKENLTKVRNKFFEAFDLFKDKEKIFITDGNRPLETVSKDIWNEVSKLIK